MLERLSPVCTLYCLAGSMAASALFAAAGASRATAAAITSFLSGRLITMLALSRWGSMPGLARWMWPKYAALPYSTLAIVQKLSPDLTVYLRGPVERGGSAMMLFSRAGGVKPMIGGSWGVMV